MAVLGLTASGLQVKERSGSADVGKVIPPTQAPSLAETEAGG